MKQRRIPLFPLHSVLFPGGVLPLRVFEPRYLDMVSDCLKQEMGFGVCLIRDGSEVGRAATTHELGTLGAISYFQNHKDGCLGITVRGMQRFRIIEQTVLPNQLTIATIELIPNEAPQPLPEQYQEITALLQKIIEQLGHPYITLPKHYEDASWVSSRLAELLPIPLAVKQDLLRLDDPIKRLSCIAALLDEMNFL